MLAQVVGIYQTRDGEEEILRKENTIYPINRSNLQVLLVIRWKNECVCFAVVVTRHPSETMKA